MQSHSSAQVWQLAEQLMTSALGALREVDELGPSFPEELYEARDRKGEGLQVVDYLERMARHSVQHRHELAGIRASIGASRPTDPGDSDPKTGDSYAHTWYQWFLLDSLLRRAEMVAELIGLSDEQLDLPPDPAHTAGNTRTIREVCEHVLQVQDWIIRGVRDGVAQYRVPGKEPPP